MIEGLGGTCRVQGFKDQGSLLGTICYEYEDYSILGYLRGTPTDRNYLILAGPHEHE